MKLAKKLERERKAQERNQKRKGHWKGNKKGMERRRHWKVLIICLVLFLPVQSLLTCFRSFLTHFADFSLTTLPQTFKAFLHFIAFSGSPTAVHRPLHALRYYCKLWAYLSEPVVKDSHKCLSLMEKPQYHVLKSLDHTLPLCTYYRENYKETLHVKKMADLVAVT